MTNKRAILWLAVVLVMLLAAHVVLHFKGVTNRTVVQRTHLREVSPDQAFRVSVVRRDSPQTLLVRTRSWRIVEPYAAFADEHTVLKMLDALTTAEIDAATSDQELLRLGRTREDFGLVTPRVRVTVASRKGDVEYAFGSVTPSGEGCYVAVSGESMVYVVSSNVFSAVDLPPEGFRRRAVFSVDADVAVSLDVKRGTGSFMRFIREGELWRMIQPREASASALRIKKLLDGLMSATVSDFIWPTGAPDEPTEATSALLAGYGLDPESAVTVTAKCTDGIDRQISFGKEASGGLVYALIQSGSAIVTMPAALKDAALAGISDFTDTRLFPLDASAMTRVSVTDGETVYLLARGEDGAWLLDAPVRAATDAPSVSAFLDRICRLHLDNVASNGVTVAVTPGDKPMTVSRDAALGDFRLEDLRSREIIRVDPSSVRRIVVTDSRALMPTAVVHDADRRAWNVESSGRPGVASEQDILKLLDALNPLRANRIVKLKVTAADLRLYGLDEPWLTVAIDRRADDAVRRNILIGGETWGGRYATLGATDAVFVLSEETIRRLASPLVTEESEFHLKKGTK